VIPRCSEQLYSKDKNFQQKKKKNGKERKKEIFLLSICLYQDPLHACLTCQLHPHSKLHRLKKKRTFRKAGA
jgi:hypothetical protein